MARTIDEIVAEEIERDERGELIRVSNITASEIAVMERAGWIWEDSSDNFGAYRRGTL